MRFDEKEAVARAGYQGTTYYFCAEHCKELSRGPRGLAGV
ncbi:MAG: copper-transporting ATPase [Gemmatimonadetes bacterium]|nr:copper-transporting ATPase [Gemmatimonadota bacterium]NIQ58989.1 copper-transporting ATPase [Gemmatimonadota bacterium]NIU79196.1 copper-transporting ATPase [Gammaproteobacteria bacterium]NIX47879.1 copper-transporting ATPase [Gemmatimonadota bacterium]